jgi:hypothetical protein
VLALFPAQDHRHPAERRVSLALHTSLNEPSTVGGAGLATFPTGTGHIWTNPGFGGLDGDEN